MDNSRDSGVIEDHVLEQAAEWFAVLQDENVSQDTKSSWSRWLDSSPQHAKAWDSIGEMAGAFQKVSEEVDSSQVRNILSAIKRGKSPGTLSSVLIFCLIGLLSFVGWNIYGPGSFFAETASYVTLVGERRFIELDDGTQVWLNTNSKLRVNYDQHLRRFDLAHGEVLIETAKDPQQKRPLVVDTEDGRMIALGTRFNVRYEKGQATELSVYDGAVKIEPDRSQAKQVVNAGRQNVFDQQTIYEGKEVNSAHQAWVKGILLAENMPLCDFLHELSRYSEDQIVCSKAVESINIVGSYSVNNIKAVFTALQSSVPVRIWQVGPNTWRVEKRK